MEDPTRAPTAPTYPHPITLRMLQLADACPDGREDFERLFGEGPFIPIESLMVRWTRRLDPYLDWAACHLMAPSPDLPAYRDNGHRLDELAAEAVPCGGGEHPKRFARERARVFARMWAELGPRPELLEELADEQATDRAAEVAEAPAPAVQVLTADMLREARACEPGVASFVRLVGGETFTPTRVECERVMTAALDADPWADPSLYYVPCHLLDAREEWHEGYRDALSRYGTVCYDDSDEGTRRAAWREYQLLRARLFADLWAKYRPAAPVAEVPTVPALTVDMVRAAGACPPGVEVFRRLAGGDSIVPTREACEQAVRDALERDRHGCPQFAWLADSIMNRLDEFAARVRPAEQEFHPISRPDDDAHYAAWRAFQLERARVFAEMWAEYGPAVSAPVEEDPLF